MNETDPFWVWVALAAALVVLLILAGLVVWLLVVVRRMRKRLDEVQAADFSDVLDEVREMHFSALDGLHRMPQRLVQELIALEDQMNRRDGRGRYARQPVTPAHAIAEDEADPLAELARMIGQTDPFSRRYGQQTGEDGDDRPAR